jgi:aspartate/methionine/tyrosine aminotransferase
VYERGISLGAVSKAHGFPGLRIGWAACRDRALMIRLADARQYLSTCSAGPSEMLACIAVKAAPLIVARNRALAEANLALLFAFLERNDSVFDWIAPEGGMVGYVRYHGRDGVEAWVIRMAETAGVLLLPSSVFRSALLELPEERFRIGFGRSGFAAGIETLETHLDEEGLLF